MSARSGRSGNEAAGESLPVRVEVDGTGRTVTVDLSGVEAERTEISTAVMEDALEIRNGDDMLTRVPLGEESPWEVAETSFNNGTYQVQVVR